jgi:hypothetical protein
LEIFCLEQGYSLRCNQLLVMSQPEMQSAWYAIRDYLLGDNEVEQDLCKALKLSSVCEHDDAVWLNTLFHGRSLRYAEDAKAVFAEIEGEDIRALCFAALVAFVDLPRLEAAAGKGVFLVLDLKRSTASFFSIFFNFFFFLFLIV